MTKQGRVLAREISLYLQCVAIARQPITSQTDTAVTRECSVCGGRHSYSDAQLGFERCRAARRWSA
jgi:hypothetical protein